MCYFSAKGYRVKLVMPACVSEERRSVLRAFGAELVLTAACARTDGAIVKAREAGIGTVNGKQKMENGKRST